MRLNVRPDSASAIAAPLPPPVAVPLVELSEHDCAYLPGRMAQMRGFYARKLSGERYHDFLNAGFRRSGQVVYQPICRTCRQCVPLRVRVDAFRPDKSQRRSLRKNADLQVEVGVPSFSQEKLLLYNRYQAEWHGRAEPHDAEEYESFLVASPVDSLEFTYRDAAGALLAVGICDICSRSLSSVYFYFEPSHARRGLGTFGALYEIDFARAKEIPYYYLGYHIDGCKSMIYKANFRPYELLGNDGSWHETSAFSTPAP